MSMPVRTALQMSALHPVAGVSPEGWIAGFLNGRLHASKTNQSVDSYKYNIDCPGLVGTPCWIGRTIEYTCIDESQVSRLYRWTPEQGIQTTDLPTGAIAAYSMADCLAVAIASPVSGHLTSLLTLKSDGTVRHSLDVPMAWRVAVEPSSTHIIWTLTRRGRRFRVTQSMQGFSKQRDPWPTAAWKRVWLDAPYPHRRIPAWVRAGSRVSKSWILLHGGPGLAWDHGMPEWLPQFSNDDNAYMLLEMPGSAGFGGKLLHWGWQVDATNEFAPVISNASHWFKERYPSAQQILCGESDGAAYAIAAACHLDAALDLLVLVNGDYPSQTKGLQAPLSAQVLMVTSDQDEVVDNKSAYRLIRNWRLQGLKVVHCRIAQGHRWESAKPSRIVAAKINSLLQGFKGNSLSLPVSPETLSL